MNEITIFQRSGSVTCDFQGIKNQLETYLKQYDGILFTEDTKAAAKKTVAELRKDRTDFLARIKDAKAEYMRPWEDFNKQAMELADMFDKPICFINEQIDIFEQKRRKDKLDTVKSIYQEFIPEEEIRAYLPFEKVYNEKWLNATYTEKAVKDDIMAAKINVKSSVKTITDFGSDVQEKALEVFKETLDLNEAMKVITTYEANKKIAVAAEKERIVEEAKEEAKAVAEVEAQEKIIESLTPVDDGSKVVPYTYTIFLNQDAKEKLEAYMNSVGIDFFSRREGK